ERRNMNFQVNPMGTVVEGNMADLLDAAREMHESIFHNVEVPRVLTTIRIDDRRDIAEHTMDKKVRSLKEKIKYKK
ncbi:MAG: thiamine-binding protein, partial [Spirochaetia bacterium]|nr:thiamine-binding protein [Spirochaetia bacterium]